MSKCPRMWFSLKTAPNILTISRPWSQTPSISPMMSASQGLYFFSPLYKLCIFSDLEHRFFYIFIIHTHACRVKPECLSVEPEKVWAFSCRKSDFIPVFTQTLSITAFIEHAYTRNSLFAKWDFLRSDLRMILKVRRRGKKWFYLLIQSDFRSFSEQNNL